MIPRILWYLVLLFLLFIIVLAMVSSYDVLDIVQTVKKYNSDFYVWAKLIHCN